MQYADFTLWQRELLGDPADAASLAARQRAYWRDALAGLPEELPLPTDRTRPARTSYRGGAVPFALDPEVVRALREVARAHDVSMFMVVQAAVAVLHNDVLPFYRTLDLPVGAVLTDNGREFCGTENHPYELYLDLNGIEHRRTKVRSPKTNGFVERFNGTVLDEFFRVKMRETFYDSVEALQADLDAWLVHYNTERPHLGYRNMGRRPVETVRSFVSQEG